LRSRVGGLIMGKREKEVNGKPSGRGSGGGLRGDATGHRQERVVGRSCLLPVILRYEQSNEP